MKIGQKNLIFVIKIRKSKKGEEFGNKKEYDLRGTATEFSFVSTKMCYADADHKKGKVV